MGNTPVVSQQRTLYVLKLQQGKYYVGVTDNLERRFQEHQSLEGSEWTKKYPLLDLYSLEPLTSDFQEDMKVKELMAAHGLDSTRGGKYSRVKLTEEERRLLTAEIEHARGLCFRCKRPGHLQSNCPEHQQKKIICERCRRNHSRENCFAHTTIEGEKLCAGINKNGLHCAKTVDERYDFCYTHRAQY